MRQFLEPDSAVASTIESISKWVGRRSVKSTICWYGLSPLMIPIECPIFVYEPYRFR